MVDAYLLVCDSNCQLLAYVQQMLTGILSKKMARKIEIVIWKGVVVRVYDEGWHSSRILKDANNVERKIIKAGNNEEGKDDKILHCLFP